MRNDVDMDRLFDRVDCSVRVTSSCGCVFASFGELYERKCTTSGTVVMRLPVRFMRCRLSDGIEYSHVYFLLDFMHCREPSLMPSQTTATLCSYCLYYANKLFQAKSFFYIFGYGNSPQHADVTINVLTGNHCYARKKGNDLYIIYVFAFV